MSRQTIDRSNKEEAKINIIRNFLREYGWKIAFAIGLLVMFLWPITMGIPTRAL